MKELNTEFLIEFFGVLDLPGWNEIARKLIENGSVIVAGTEPIWKGGIGNFIKTRKDPRFFACLEYIFDVKSFTQSAYFKEAYRVKMKNFANEKRNIEDKMDAMSFLYGNGSLE